MHVLKVKYLMDVCIIVKSLFAAHLIIVKDSIPCSNVHNIIKTVLVVNLELLVSLKNVLLLYTRGINKLFFADQNNCFTNILTQVSRCNE